MSPAPPTNSLSQEQERSGSPAWQGLPPRRALSEPGAGAVLRLRDSLTRCKRTVSSCAQSAWAWSGSH